MSADHPPTDPPSLWQGQPAEPLPPLSPEALRAQAGKFEKTIGRRNLGEYLAAAFVVAIFGWRALTAPGVLAKVGPAMMVVAAIYIVWRLATRGGARPLPPEALATSSLSFYRAELERQRALLRSIWRWYLGPMLPGFVFMLAESALADPRPARLVRIAVFAAFFALMLLIVAKANRMAADKLDQELAQLGVD